MSTKDYERAARELRETVVDWTIILFSAEMFHKLRLPGRMQRSHEEALDEVRRWAPGARKYMIETKWI